MTRGSRRYLRPDAIARIARLELRARAVVEGVLAGLHKSPFKGQSVAFLQHREYAPDDDLRRVDWKVWARQDRLTVKEFEEGRRIAWAHVGGHRWRYELEPLADGGTRVTETFDGTYARSARALRLIDAYARNARGIEETLPRLKAYAEEVP